MSQQKNQERPRLLFEEEEREDKVEKDFVESKETHEGNVVSFNSLREEEENKHERDEGGGERGGATAGGEWIEHERSSPFHEENSRPSMSSTAGKGLFARCYNMSNSTTSFTFKVVFLGDPSVGKTCVAKLYINRKPPSNVQSTIAFDCKCKDVDIDGIPSTLQVWDTAGMEQFRRGLVMQYYRNVDGVVFVYDITRRESFVDIQEWLGELRQYCRNSDRVQMALLGNKCDLEGEREVPTDEGRGFAEENGMIFAEISAKTEGALVTIDSVFDRLSSQMLRSRQENSLTRSMVEQQQQAGAGIRLEHEWVLIDEFPQGPFPAHDNQRRRTPSRRDLEQSFRSLKQRVRTNGRPRLPFRNRDNSCPC